MTTTTRTTLPANTLDVIYGASGTNTDRDAIIDRIAQARIDRAKADSVPVLSPTEDARRAMAHSSTLTCAVAMLAGMLTTLAPVVLAVLA